MIARLGEAAFGAFLGVGSVAGALQPAGEGSVQRGALRFQQALVGDLARERVLDDVFALAGDRRAGAAADELALLEQLEVRKVAVDQLADGSGPEDAPNHRGGLERRLLHRRQ